MIIGVSHGPAAGMSPGLLANLFTVHSLRVSVRPAIVRLAFHYLWVVRIAANQNAARTIGKQTTVDDVINEYATMFTRLYSQLLLGIVVTIYVTIYM